MFVTRWKLSLILMIAIATSAATHATETDPYADPKWPNIASDGPQWPNANLDDPPSPPPNPRPAFLGPDQVTARMGRSRGAGSGLLDVDTTGSTAQWPKLPKEEQPSSFMFEAGARYWYSSGTFRFAFSNGNPLFGTPTSTLDWLSMDDHSGEGFVRLETHQPAISSRELSVPARLHPVRSTTRTSSPASSSSPTRPVTCGTAIWPLP